MANQGTINFSSNPLSTSFSQFSEEKPPTYEYALTYSPQQQNPLYNPGDFIKKNIGNEILTNISSGTVTQDSTNFEIAQKGRELLQSGMNKATSIIPTNGQTPAKQSFFNKIGGWQTVGAAADMLGSFMPEKSEYSGAKGNFTQTLDNVYDTTQNFAGNIPVYGKFIQTGMGINKLAGNVLNKITGGTSGMTSIDAALGSDFANLTGVGLVANVINSTFGKKADTITKNEQVFKRVRSSYGGTSAAVDDALEKSGKKYGLFSSGAREDTNEETAEAKRQQNRVEDIDDEAIDRFAIRDSMAAINGNRRKYYLQGDYNQANVRVGKFGMSLDLIAKAKKILGETRQLKSGGKVTPTEILLVVPEFQDGGRISKKIRDYYKDYNLDGITLINDSSPRTENDTIYSPSDEFTVHELWHYISQNKPNEALKEFYDSLNDNKLLQFGADLDFVKRTGDPSDFYNPSELEARLKAAKFMSQGQNYTKDFFKNLRSNENQYGDNMRDLLRMFNDDYLEKLFNINSAQKFQEGGSINVIPEGALHARKHNMDMEGITKKGIPVVDNNGVQQAEIERSEIIYRKSITEELEKLCKIYYDESIAKEEKDKIALEAGKLLVKETLYNTIDNTKELL